MGAEGAVTEPPLDLGVLSLLLDYETVRRWADRIKFSKFYEYVL